MQVAARVSPAEEEHLHLDAGWETALASREPLDAVRCGPKKHAGVAAVLLVFPLDDQLKIRDLFFGADDADRFAGALNGIALE